jgi:hypothetical protein
MNLKPWFNPAGLCKNKSTCLVAYTDFNSNMVIIRWEESVNITFFNAKTSSMFAMKNIKQSSANNKWTQ